MKNLKKLILIIFGLTCQMASAQDAPDFYLRGSDIPADDIWGLNENYKFTRNGDNYSIHVELLTGEFKISNQDWSINYGGARGESPLIYSSAYIRGVADGINWESNNLKNVDISFKYNGSGEVVIKFMVDGVEPPAQQDPLLSQLSGTLPVLYINVFTDAEHTALENEIIDKDLNHKNYFKNAEYWLDLNGCKWLEELGATSVGSKEEPLPLEIKARGNWTRVGFSKKPFKLKLGSKQNLLNLTPKKSKHYAILAHADDNYSYLRNFTGFNLGQRIGLPWTPSQQPIEVVINGDYRGLYFLTESIRIGDGRINITELDDNVSDPALVSGGYLVELDNYEEENQIRFREKPYSNGDEWVRVTFDTPEEYSAIQYQFISEQFNAINDLIGENQDDVWRYLDLDDAARYYIVEEIVGHTESYHGSTYLFRDFGVNQKWHFSPLWDFGNAFNGPTDNYFFNRSPFGTTWIHSLVKNSKFADKVRETWKWFMSNCYEGLSADIEEYCNHLSVAAQADYNRWHKAERPNYPGASAVTDNRDIAGGMENVKRYLREKINWLKGEFGDYEKGIYAEPSRDQTPAAELPDYIASGVEILPESVCTDKDVYYTIDGLKVMNPEKGVYIKVSGDKTEKTIIK